MRAESPAGAQVSGVGAQAWIDNAPEFA